MLDNHQEDEDQAGPDESDGDELYEHHRIVVDRGQELLRIDKFLLSRLRNTSRNKVQEAIRALAVEVNGAAVKPNYRVKPQDLITVTLPEPPREGRVVPEAIVLKAASVPGQFVSDRKLAAVVAGNTVSVAQFVTLLHAPATSTQ